MGPVDKTATSGLNSCTSELAFYGSGVGKVPWGSKSSASLSESHRVRYMRTADGLEYMKLGIHECAKHDQPGGSCADEECFADLREVAYVLDDVGRRGGAAVGWGYRGYRGGYGAGASLGSQCSALSRANVLRPGSALSLAIGFAT